MVLSDRESVKRLVIYFFYDRDGVVDRYVPYVLNALKPFTADLFVVANGKLTGEGRAILTEITPDILVRDNKGFDVWAYKEALETVGWDKLGEYDEVIMMNHTIMGPVCSLEDMFRTMDGKDLDFWGVTKHHKIDFDPFFAIEYGYVPEHIQSHFIAVRKPMLTSMEFRKYWESRPEINSYEEAVGKHEAIFTRKFAEKGFSWSVYCDTTDLDGFTYYPMKMCPVELIRDYGCPFFKRRNFFDEYSDLLGNSSGEQGKKLMAYLRDRTDYDTGMIWENILRTCHMADIKRCTGLSYVLPRDTVAKKEEKMPRIALVMHLYYEDLVEQCFQYACSMPQSADVILTLGSDKLEEKAREVFAAGKFHEVKIVRIENRGRDVSALLTGAAPYLKDYDYVCFMHDKKVTQLDLGIKGYHFSERCYQNLLGSRELVENIIGLFQREPYLGILMPPPPNHADYFPTLGLEWGPNFEITEKIKKELDLHVPMDEDHEPISPLGTMFWFRYDAMKKIIEKGWKYTDFPKEPLKTDGTYLHGIERIYSFVAQDAGYYGAWVTSDDYMRTEWENLSYMLRSFNTRLFRVYCTGDHCGECGVLDRLAANPNAIPFIRRKKIKAKLKRHTPKFLWNFLRKIYRSVRKKKD